MIDIIIADDHELFHVGMGEVLESAEDLRLLGEAHSPEQLLQTLEVCKPHVLLLSTNFLPAFPKIKPILNQRQTALLMLAEDDDRAAYVPQLGARGIVYRSMNGPTLVEAMRRVAKGEVFVQTRSTDMRGDRLLYVCYDPTSLLSRERFLMSMGYQVCTVFGGDGLMARMDMDYFDFAVIGEAGPLAERQAAVRLLKEAYPHTPVIALCREAEKIGGTDYHVSVADADIWPDEVVSICRR